MERVEIIGNIGRDAETKTIGNNDYAAFSVAVTDKYGETERTTWYACLKLDKNKKLVNHLTKGTKVYVSGRPQANAYTNDKGQTIASINVWVNELEFCGGKADKTEKAEQTPSPKPIQPVSNDNDDLPF